MIRVTSFGKSKNEWRDQLIKQIQGLTAFEWIEISIKKIPDKRTTQLMPEEQKFLRENSNFFLLEDSGKEMNSPQFAEWCFKSSRHLIVGPSVGFHPEFREKSLGQISLSKLTFTHALAQTVLAEAIYRSACIQKNHPFVK